MIQKRRKPRRGRVIDREYMDWIRSLPCLGENMRDSSLPQWDYGSRRVWSLLDMFRRDAARFVWIGNVLQNLYSNSQVDLTPDNAVGPERKPAMLEGLSGVRSDCLAMGLCKTAAVLGVVIHDYEANLGQTYGQLRRSVAYINTAFNAELQEHIFVQIDPARALNMRTTEQFAADPLFGQKVADQFSSSNLDVLEAGMCLTVERYTACVFHCMRVVEKGLCSLAKVLNVPFKIPFEYENWHNIIEPIEKAIHALEQSLPKGAGKAETLKFYSQAASQFFYFKNAWRNHVAHARETYSAEQADVIFNHTRDFMCYLADGGLHD